LVHPIEPNARLALYIWTNSPWVAFKARWYWVWACADASPCRA
jgi:hypothetical protein